MMHATLLDTITLAADGQHNAFTSLCQWRGDYYLAYRVAPSHAITPPGHVVVSTRVPWDISQEQRHILLGHPRGDVRDPRLLPTDEALFCLTGVYLPAPQHLHWHGLSPASTDNLLVTHLTHTVDGVHWSPLQPILRPQYWGWSTVSAYGLWYVAAYHVGTREDHAMSLALFAGPDLWSLGYGGTIYDGASYARSGKVLDYPHLQPCEPVLWQPTADTLGCLVRTGSEMDSGLGRRDFSAWRWHSTRLALHPSAVLQTPHGWVLAAREVTTHDPSLRQDRGPTAPEQVLPQTVWRTALYALDPGQHRPRHLLTLPSWGDTGYASLALGAEPDTLLMSFYTQAAPKDPRSLPLPGADIVLATVRLEA